MKPFHSIENFYMLVRVGKRKWTNMPCAWIALFDEISVHRLGRVLNEVSSEELVIFMSKFKSIKIYLGRSAFDLMAYRWRLPMERHSSLVVITDEEGFKMWRHFLGDVFKSSERGLAVSFQREL